MEYINREHITENVAIIKINKSYKTTMTALELYDCTRGCWKRRLESIENAEYAFAVVKGLVKEVYYVDSWMPAKELSRETIPYDETIEANTIREKVKQYEFNYHVDGYNYWLYGLYGN